MHYGVSMIDYLDDPQYSNNASVKIFKQLFEIDIPMHFLYEAKYLETHNPMLDDSGNTNIEAALRKTRIRIPIAGIVQHYVSGSEMEFVNPQDTYTIYSIIMQHLNDWLAIIHGDFIAALPPMVELRSLELLAEGLHIYAQSYKPENGGGGFAGFANNKLSNLRFSKITAERLAPLSQRTMFEPITQKIYNTAKARGIIVK